VDTSVVELRIETWIETLGRRAGSFDVHSRNVTNTVARLLSLAQNLALERPGFFDVKGPSAGDKDTAAFMSALRIRAADAFRADFAEQKICGPNGLCVDYYFPEDGVIVEIAMGLRNPNSEFERDILKAIMAKDAGYVVRQLAFIAKPGASKKCSQPSARAIIDWAARAHGLTVTVQEIVRP
jgi:hypothetical protein